MTREGLTVRLAGAQRTAAHLRQQRARLVALQDLAAAQLNATQGRIAELTELIALIPVEPEKVGGTD